MGLKVGCTSVPDTTSMTAFLDNTDLMSHMFGFITEKEEKQSATLVCKGWRELSHTFPTWRKARLNIKFKNEENLERKEEQVQEPSCYELAQAQVRAPFLDEYDEEQLPWDASMSIMKGMLTHRKHITQYDLNFHSRYTDWWADLATFMPHLTWLSLGVEDRVDFFSPLGFSLRIRERVYGRSKVEIPFALEGLPNLTFLHLGGFASRKHVLSSLSLRLPALQTLELEEHRDRECAIGVRELDIECPSLVSIRVTIHAELSMSTSWFAHLRSLNLTLHDVSAYLYNEYCLVINLGVF